jgi:hypothetical protein
LPNDTQQRTAANLIVKRNWNGYRRGFEALLHNLMAASLPHGDESVLFQNATNLRAR